MPSLSELGFDQNRRREAYAPNTSNVADIAVNFPLSQVNQLLQDKSLDLTKLTIDTFTVNQWLRGGSTAYNTGAGWWIGNDGLNWKFSLRGSSGDYFIFDGVNVSLSGALVAGSIHIPDLTTANSFHTNSTGNSWWGCNVASFGSDPNNATAYILNTGVAKFRSVTLSGSVIATDFQPGTDIAIQGWSSTVAFVASTYRTVTWSAGGTGTIKVLDGTVYTIAAGTTGNIAALTYIYLDIATSVTVLQTTTTYSNAVGKGKILVAVASPNADTASKAQFQVFGGYGGVNLFVDNLSANSASTNEFVSNTAQIKNLIVTNAKINDLAVDKLTAGSITSKAITLAIAAGTGDSYIAAGKTDFTNVETGFILGMDDSDGDKPKFFIGSSTSYLNWDGTALTVAGTITATAGAIGGWTINATSITDTAGVVGLSSAVTVGDDIRFWAGHATPASAPFRVTEAGALVATSATITGSITATSGAIGGWAVASTYIYFDGATDALSAGMASADYPFYAGKKYVDRATAPFRVTPDGALYASSATITGALTAGAGSSIATTYLSGIVGLANTNIAAQGWTFTGVFSSTDYNTISWTSGTFTTSGGTAYSIDAGNTGNMAAVTYIFLDTAVSNTVLQITTTATSAIGTGRVLIAVANLSADITSDATVQVFGGTGGQILSVDQISANSASTNEFVSNSAQLANLVVTNAKINDLSVAKLTAGIVASKSIELTVSEGTGDSEIRSGIASGDFANTGAASGWIIGVDDSDANKVKFYLGCPTGYIKFDGTNFTLLGGVDISSKLDKLGGSYDSAAAGSARVRIFPDANTGILVEDSAANPVFKALVGGTDVGDVIMGKESTGNYAKWDESADLFLVNGSPIRNEDKFGDGSDGDVTIETDTTLTRDMFYNNLAFAPYYIYTFGGITSQCGYVQENTTTTSWATMRAAAGDSAVSTSIQAAMATIAVNQWDYFRRGILQFNTAAITDTDTIAAATVKIYVTGVTDNLNQSLRLVKGVNAGALAAGDYAIAGWDTTACCDTDYDLTTIGTNAYLTFTLNAAGMAWLSKTGNSYFGLMLVDDATNTPTAWINTVTANVTAQTVGDANPPVLSITTDRVPTLFTNGYKGFVRNIHSGFGYVVNNGGNAGNGTNAVAYNNPGTAGAAGAVAPGNSVPPSQIGVIGKAGSNQLVAGVIGSTGTRAAKAVGDSNGIIGGAGGGGGTAGGPAGGGAGGPAGAKSGTILNRVNNYVSAYLLSDTIGSFTNFTVNAGPGSGGGGAGGGRGNASDFGGGGGGSGGSGGGGGIVWWAARIITFTGEFRVLGGDGGDGGNGSNGTAVINSSWGGGGGGGGAGSGGTGGVIIIITSSSTATYTTSVLGGLKGTGGLKGLGYSKSAGGVVSPNPTYDGANGSDGFDGNPGRVITLIV